MEKLKNKVAVVTGGSAGIGKAIALEFAAQGAKVMIVGRNEAKLKAVAALNPRITYVVGDITDETVIAHITTKLNQDYQGQLDILVNNAGWCPVQPVTAITLADYDQAFNLDVRAVVAMTISTLPLLLKSKGNIINLSSVGARHPGANLSLYVGAKAAIENFTKVWALDLARAGVRVNAIAPGAVDTDIWNVPGLTPEAASKHKAGIAAEIPCGRFAAPAEIAKVALFLASEDASYVTGAVYAVDGGMGAK